MKKKKNALFKRTKHRLLSCLVCWKGLPILPPLGVLDTETIIAPNLNDALSNHREAAGPQTHFWVTGWAWRKHPQVRFGEKLFTFPTVCSWNAVWGAPWPRPSSLCWAQCTSWRKELGIGTALQSGTCKFPLQSVARGRSCFFGFLSAQGWASSLWCKGSTCGLPEWRWIIEGRDVLPGRRAQATPSSPCRENSGEARLHLAVSAWRKASFIMGLFPSLFWSPAPAFTQLGTFHFMSGLERPPSSGWVLALCDTERSALLRDRDQWSDGSSPAWEAPHSASPFKDLLFVCFSWRTHLLQSLHLKGEKPEARGAIPPIKETSAKLWPISSQTLSGAS